MISYLDTRLQEIDAPHKVIPVNCVGVPGAGLAGWWAHDPSTDQREVSIYKSACRNKNIDPGDILIFKSGTILAATKGHYIHPSNIAWISEICEKLVSRLDDPELDKPVADAIAIPKLGCGLGRLNWEQQVMPLYDKYFTSSRIHFLVSLK